MKRLEMLKIIFTFFFLIPIITFGQSTWDSPKTVNYDSPTGTIVVQVKVYSKNYNTNTSSSGTLEFGTLQYVLNNNNNTFFNYYYLGLDLGYSLNNSNSSSSQGGDNQDTYATVTLNITDLTKNITGIKLFAGHVINSAKAYDDQYYNSILFPVSISQISSFNTPTFQFLPNNITRIFYTKDNASGAGIDDHSTINLLDKDNKVLQTNNIFSKNGYFDITTLSSNIETNYSIQQSVFNGRMTLSSPIVKVGAFTQPTSITASYDVNNQSVNLSWGMDKVNTQNYYSGGFKIQQDSTAAFSNPIALVSPDYNPLSDSYSINLYNNNITPRMYFRVVRDNGIPNWTLGKVTNLPLNIIPLNIAGIGLILENDTAKITWNPQESAWIPGASFIITRRNISTSIYSPIVLTKNDYLLGYYGDDQIALCNKYKYSLQILPPQGSFFPTNSPLITQNTILPVRIGIVKNLTASKGYFPSRTELTWSTEGAFDNFNIERAVYGTQNYVQLATVAGSSNNSFQTDDLKGTPGVYYTYRVTGVIKCNDASVLSNSIDAVGFRSPTGNIYGRVTYDNGQGVKNASVRLQSNDVAPTGKSIYLNGGDSSYLKLDSLITPFQHAPFTVEAWIKPDNNISGKQVLFSQGKQYELGLKNDSVYFKDNQDSAFAAFKNPNSSFIHIAGIRTDTSLMIMLNDSVLIKKNLKRPTLKIINLGKAVYIGCDSNTNNKFKGYLDEMRIWNTLKDSSMVAGDYKRLLTGGESGLVAYWRFDEGIENQFYDLSSQGDSYNKNNGFMSANFVSRSNTIPTPDQLSLNGITDNSGSYIVSGIPYTGNGTTYTIVPLLGTHQFDPSLVKRLLSSNSNEFTVDFKDKSSFLVGGKVTYVGGTFPVAGVMFKIDNNYAQSSNGTLIVSGADGSFEISVPVGHHRVEAIMNNHKFADSGKIIDLYQKDLDYQAPIVNLKLYDSTTVRLIGRVVGGAIESAYPIGHSLSHNNLGKEISIVLQAPTGSSEIYSETVKGITDTIIVKHYLPSNQSDSNKVNTSKVVYENDKIIIYPNSITGEYVADLIPIKYTVSHVNITGWGDLVGTSETLNLTNKFSIDSSINQYSKTVTNGTINNIINYTDIVKYNAVYSKIHRVNPEISINQTDVHNNLLNYFGDTTYQNTAGTPNYISLIDKKKVGLDKYLFNGHPVFRQGNTYNFILKAFETYNYFESDLNNIPIIKKVNGFDVISKVPSKGGLVSFKDYIQKGSVPDSTITLDADGKCQYSLMAGDPNTGSTYLKNFSASVNFGTGANYSWKWPDGSTTMSAYVMGAISTGETFVTAGPNDIIMVLRDPPGSTSYSYALKGSVFTSTSSYTTALDDATNGSLGATVGAEVTTFAGIGAGIIIKTSALVTGTYSLHHEDNRLSSDTYTSSNTLTTNFQTSSNPNLVGAPADVFVGNSTNITYGESKNISIVARKNIGSSLVLFDPPGIDYVIVQKNGTRIGRSFNTLFAYTQTHIENVLIPNLKSMRNILLSPIGTIGGQDSANKKKLPYYVSTLATNNINYGKSNTDTVFKVNNIIPLGSSYKVFFPKDSIQTDTIYMLNQFIDKWVIELSKNEKSKLKSTLLKNYSFTAGSPIAYSEQSSGNSAHTESFHFLTSGAYTVNGAFTYAGLGITYSLSETVAGGHGQDITNENDSSSTIGFNLSSNGIDDYLSVDVRKDTTGNFVFKTMGGVTGCPYEGANITKYYMKGEVLDVATQKIEVPNLSVENAVVNNIPSSRSASYILSLNNESEAKLSNTYILTYADNDNIKGATISIDGSPIGGSGRTITVPYGSTIKKVLTFMKGPVEMDYDNIKIILKSGCDDNIADSVSISAHFIPSCSDIHIKSPDNNWVLNTNNRYLPIVMDQFDVNNPLFDHIELQYKPHSDSKWKIFMKFFADSVKLQKGNGGDKMLISNAESINYEFIMDDLSFQDQNYDIRAVSVCKVSDSKSVTTETDIITGIKDTYNPRLFGSPQPANGILGINDNLRLNFNETIASGLLSKDKITVTGIRNGIIGNHNVSVSLDGVAGYVQTEFSKNLTRKNITTELWILPNKSANGTIFSQGSSSESMELSLTSDNYLQITLGSKNIQSDKPVDYKKGEWAHVALVYNASDLTVSAFYNFIEVIHAVSVNDYSGNGSYQFGRSIKSAGNFFAGKMHRAVTWSQVKTTIDLQTSSLLQLSGSENNLLGYYSMDEGKGSICFDKAHGSNAILNGTWSTPAGKAMNFDGQAHLKMETGISPITSDMDYSMELWFKGDPNQSDAALVSNGRGDNSDAGKSKNNFFLGFENQILTFQNNGFKVQAPGNYLDNNWHHVALTINRTAGIAQIYADGIMKISFDSRKIGGAVAAYTYLGVRPWNNPDYITTTTFDRFFKGNIDEFRIWNTYLNQTLINKNNNTRLKGDEIGLMVYYPFETYKTTSNGQQQMDSTLMDLKIQSDTSVHAFYATAVQATISNEMAPIKDRGPISNLDFKYVINNDALIINMTEPKQSIDKTIITVQVKKVKDLNGNEIFSPITWSAYIDQNQLKWSDVSLNLSKSINAPMQFESYLVNSGGDNQNYNLSNLPRWLTADVSSGTVPPLGKQKIIFTVNEALNIGTYDEVLFMLNDYNVAEALALNMVVKGKQPAWSVNPAAFKYNMNVYGKLRINSIYSIDKDDVLAAFVNGKCVGVAKNAYNEQSNLWFAYLTIYNDSIQNANLKFRIWQASTGKVFQAITSTDVSFVSNSIAGSVRNPIIFDGKENIFQDISLNKGWNWISFNVLDKSNATNINETLSNGNWSAGDLIKNENLGFSQYGNISGWLGYLAGVDNTSLFTLKTNNAQSLSVSGVAVDVRVTPIPVSGNRWSYISYLPLVNLTLKDALADFDAKNEDVIKSQSGFAMYDDVVGWVGNLTYMEPGKGYMLYHNSIDSTSFHYPMVRSLFKVAPIKNYISGIGINYAQIPVAANTGFSQNMTVTAKEGTGFNLQPNDLVIAYSAGEIRAKSRLIENAVLKTPTLFFNISGEQDEAIYFQVERNGTVVAQSETVLNYGANTQVGTLSKPLLLNFTDASNSILVYPNPFAQKVMINLNLAGSSNEAHSVQLSIYNAMGQSVSTLPEKQAKSGIFQTYWNGKTGAGVNCTPGVYFIHITIDGVTQVQKVIKN